MPGFPPKKKAQHYQTEGGALPGPETNERYSSKGTLGSYRTSAEQFQNPKGVRVFEGFGADEEDLERGFCEPGITDAPVYAKSNYEDRWTEPKEASIGPEDHLALPDDFEFRMRERKSRGFLTRPRIPTERN